MESALGYTFRDRQLLERALTHRSYASEHAGAQDNERLEFVGDAVLQLIVTEYLFVTQPTLKEGQMAKVRAGCVNRDELAMVARRVGLGDAIRLGVGERQSLGADKTSILADAMEAVIAAVFFDGGVDEARRVVLHHWSHIVDTKAEAPGKRDYKTRLQEKLASSGGRPKYTMSMDGPDHARTFTAVVWNGGTELGAGSGASKKEAQQAAAEVALSALPMESGDTGGFGAGVGDRGPEG